MDSQMPMLQEFMARKEQVLNLEMRLFIIVFAIELAFLFFYLYWKEKLRNEKSLSIIALSVYLVLFFEMIAINGKMGLISMYLRQMESFLTSLGYQGVIWESVALDKIIFVPGNAFTLPAFLTILILLCQTFYAFYFTFCSLFQSKTKIIFSTIISILIIILLVIKTVTVDFYRELPSVF